MGVHKNTYARWEREERELGASDLARLIAMGWNPDWVLTGEGPERRGDHLPGVAESSAEYGSAPPFERDRWERAKHIVALAALDISGGVSHTAFADAVAAVYWQASERPLANADLPALVALAHGLLAPATRSTG